MNYFSDLMKNVQIFGFEDMDKESINIVIKKVSELISRLERIFGESKISDFKLVANKIRKREHVDYEISAHLDTPFGHFRTSKTGWKIVNITEKVLEELERLVIEKKERYKNH